jgi:hypothetical protein
MTAAMTKLLVHDRDKLLVMALDSVIKARADEAIVVAWCTALATCPLSFGLSPPSASSRGALNG